ncbi:EAL domain-containing protein [Marinobacter mobilis]|uniref:EAL domain-containing protein n=1 Tax=Marinobacter mobilis TaxID=488533 RepID=A0A1H3EBE4_9GAMM|nr:EAL domain-containing protein [Marinobacter mobilis]SDX75209.1 EAL domain-containing protein [Marinobacter mobilis]
MKRLRDMGISISIDDFGTGFSCLTYLKDLPVDVLKIDKSFVAQISENSENEALVRTIAALADNMRMSSIAEGVETSQQVAFLKKLGVSLLQGFYFSKPVTASELQLRYAV